MSPAVASAASLPAATWALSVSANRGSFSSSQAYLRYHIYRWTSGNAFGGDIVPWTTYGTAALGSSTASVNITTPTGAATSLAVGDKVVVDLEVESMNTTSSVTANANILFGATASSQLVAPAKVSWTYTTPAVVPAYGHLRAHAHPLS